MAAYKGTTVHGFPNLFMIVGPNTGLGPLQHGVHHRVAGRLHPRRASARCAQRGYAAVEPRAEAQQAWNADLQRRMKRTVWNTGGCSSWYLDAHGRNTDALAAQPRSRSAASSPGSTPRRTTCAGRTTATRRGGLAHEDARRQGRRDHRRRLRHRPRARASTSPAGARCSRSPTSTRPGSPRPSTWSRTPAPARSAPTALDVADRAAFAAYAADGRRALRPGQRRGQQRRRRARRRLRGPRRTPTWTGSSASTSGASSTAPRSSCPT